MAEFNTNLWAPWRAEYLRSVTAESSEDGCFFCRYWSAPQQDAVNYVVLRSAHGLLVMNRFPYTGGHLMVTIARHKSTYEELDESELSALSTLTRDATRLLREVLRPEGFNIGANIGRCAGAGVPGHLHVHIVPRWSGDTNYMSVLAGTRVISESLDSLYRELTAAANRLGLVSTEELTD
ncbi:MAG TPA: HIT domain-containing protein [Phycisphaerae bacterium]|jgi:ATP adenylyltransferase